MHTSTDDAMKFGERMLELLKRQHPYVVELQKMAREQRDLIRAQQGEELLRLLARRQKIVEAIGRISQESMEYRRDWPTMRDRLPDHLRKAIGEWLEQLQRMLDEILEQDRQDCQELSAAKSQVAQELGRTSQARAAHAHYRPTADRGDGDGERLGFQATG